MKTKLKMLERSRTLGRAGTRGWELAALRVLFLGSIFARWARYKRGVFKYSFLLSDEQGLAAAVDDDYVGDNSGDCGGADMPVVSDVLLFVVFQGI